MLPVGRVPLCLSSDRSRSGLPTKSGTSHATATTSCSAEILRGTPLRLTWRAPDSGEYNPQRFSGRLHPERAVPCTGLATSGHDARERRMAKAAVTGPAIRGQRSFRLLTSAATKSTVIASPVITSATTSIASFGISRGSTRWWRTILFASPRRACGRCAPRARAPHGQVTSRSLLYSEPNLGPMYR